MTTLILSGGGYSGNWLPLIAPLAAIVIILYAGDAAIKFVKKRRLHTHAPMDGDANITDNSNPL